MPRREHEPALVDTYGLRKTGHVFGAISLDDAKFTFQSAPVFNGKTFREFLCLLVRRYDTTAARCS